MFNKKLPNHQRGQGLLELIIAIGIILACTIATLTLVITSIQAGRRGTDKIIATNLAREGIELVRNIRDSNWINATSNIENPLTTDVYKWDDGLVGPSNDSTAIPIIDNTNPSSIDFTPNSWTDKCNEKECTRIFLTGDNYYIQNTDPSGTALNFYRLLYLNPICLNPNDGTEKIVDQEETVNCGGSGYESYTEKIGIRVISEVRWPSPDKNKVILEDRLYNWRTI